jgi:hypothetical protein
MSLQKLILVLIYIAITTEIRNYIKLIYEAFYDYKIVTC